MERFVRQLCRLTLIKAAFTVARHDVRHDGDKIFATRYATKCATRSWQDLRHGGDNICDTMCDTICNTFATRSDKICDTMCDNICDTNFKIVARWLLHGANFFAGVAVESRSSKLHHYLECQLFVRRSAAKFSITVGLVLVNTFKWICWSRSENVAHKSLHFSCRTPVNARW